MITIHLDWREVLWWMQGGMAGSHHSRSVYEDMVNKVWPQCSEQERRNLWLIMRRDLGSYWRPDGWSGYGEAHGEGEWKPAAAVLTYSDDKHYDPAKCITDLAPWNYFRQVLARFDPENQYAVTMRVHNQKELDDILRDRHMGHLIDWPKLSHVRGVDWESDTTTVTVRTYKWKDANDKDAYFIDWRHRCDPDKITKVERIDIPDDGTM